MKLLKGEYKVRLRIGGRLWSVNEDRKFEPCKKALVEGISYSRRKKQIIEKLHMKIIQLRFSLSFTNEDSILYNL